MAYFIFQNNQEGVEYSIYKIAETQNDLDNLNIIKDDYKIIEDLNVNFNDIKLSTKLVISYTGNNITYKDCSNKFDTQEHLKKYILEFKDSINIFLENNKNHIHYQKWKDYLNQLNNVDISTLSFPYEKSLQQYFNDQNQAVLNPLQLP